MIRRLLFAWMGSVLAMMSCTQDVESYTKEEARELGGRTPDGEDICSFSGWYADSICDDFCPLPDPVCPSCLAIPTCGPGEETHASRDDCPVDATCREESECGSAVWCSDGS